MSEEKLLTLREVSSYLGIPEKEVVDLADAGTIPSYKIGGVYLRFKQQEIEAYRKTVKPAVKKEEAQDKYTLQDRVSDFFYFNDFYLLAALLIAAILAVITKG